MSLLTVLIVKKVWGATIGTKKLVKYILIFLAGLFVAQIVGLALWYGPISVVVNEADPLLTFLTFKPILWETIFEGEAKLYHEPIGKFFTSGQIANVYYGLAHILSLLGLSVPGLILYFKHKNKPQLFLMIGSTIFILQTAIIAILMLLIEL